MLPHPCFQRYRSSTKHILQNSTCHQYCSFIPPILLSKTYGTLLVVQWLGLRASTARGMDSIPGWGTKIPHAMQCGQKNKVTKNCTASFQFTLLSDKNKWNSRMSNIYLKQKYSGILSVIFYAPPCLLTEVHGTCIYVPSHPCLGMCTTITITSGSQHCLI